ncbi:MAG: TolC family outer membrane protein [Rhodospirillales bacterium]|nr:TolC family outer membrane protein [Rhodospirillales bacterium]
MRGSVSQAALAAALFWGFSGGLAQAQTFEEALAQAYATHPSLQAKRAKLRATDELVPQAIANWRPSVTAKTDVGKVMQESNLSNPKEQKRTYRMGQVAVTQPLFRGGKTLAATDKAEEAVLAERSSLAVTEQQVLLDAATAYLDNLRDQAVLDLNISNEQVLRRQLEATRNRFQVGEITRTDVSQSEARLAKSLADRVKAEGDLKVSRAVFKNLIGDAPHGLRKPSMPNSLPGNEEEAVRLAMEANPSVVLAEHTERSARHNIDLVRGDLFPSLSVTADANRTLRSTAYNSRTQTAEIIATLNIPIYEGGAATYSKLREAKQTAGQRRLEIDQARRSAVETATKAYENLTATRARIRALDSQINAAEIALDGVKREAEAGTRTVLDVLDSEQELLDARVNRVKSERDELVAAYSLKAAIGQLTARGLGLPVEPFDPEANYQKVRSKIFGAPVEPVDGKP